MMLSGDAEGGVVAPAGPGAVKRAGGITDDQAALAELGLGLILPTIAISVIDRRKHPLLWWFLGPVSGTLAATRYAIRRGIVKRP